MAEMYRIVKEKPYYSIEILFAGTKKECQSKLKGFKKNYPKCEIEPVDNTLKQAISHHWYNGGGKINNFNYSIGGL